MVQNNKYNFVGIMKSRPLKWAKYLKIVEEGKWTHECYLFNLTVLWVTQIR
jgi:hypothetical protein